MGGKNSEIKKNRPEKYIFWTERGSQEAGKSTQPKGTFRASIKNVYTKL